MWVVKLGGSLAGTPQLQAWLRLLAKRCAGPVVLVPGGGPFADQVRDAQRQWDLRDETAHAMALLAMAQYGLALVGMEPRLCSVHGISEIKPLLIARQSVVWIPGLSDVRDITLPASWETSADSIAVWLAGKLGATHMLLVKSTSPNEKCADVQELMQCGIVDLGFARALAGKNLSVWWAGRDQHMDIQDLSVTCVMRVACHIQSGENRPAYGPAVAAGV